ncbi:MAG: hypothetical protein OEY84_01850 [Rhodospirillaceae bacterium]|nr:hypothetical protein [Rhodospirillaceae bacterium]
MIPVHRMYFHYSEYPPSMRVLFTGTLLVLGLAYIFAMIQTYVSHAARDGNPGLSVQDLVIAYSGTRTESRLEAAIKGPMSDNIDPEDAGVVSLWVHQGANEEKYVETIQPILEDNCVACHDGSNPHLPNLTDYSVIEDLIKVDTGVSVYTLVRVSHIHLFGITFIFFIMGFMFTHALIRPVWLKCVTIGVPFLAIILDIMSWYLTKIHPGFAWVVYIGGMFMALSFAFMWVTSMYQMWFMRPPEDMVRETPK